MGPDNRYRAFVAVITMAVVFLLAAGPIRAESADKAEETIHYLISYVSGSGLTFIRNDREYTAGEAATHMNRKYQHFRDDIETPDEFIERCATKSLLSGDPYLVVDGRGIELRTSDWLRTELAAYQARSQ